MTSRSYLVLAVIAAAEALCSPAMAQTYYAPPYDQLGAARAAGEDPNYHVNRYGFGNYVRGPNGSFGGYPAGSAGAIELENEQRIKCRDYPESC